MIRLAVFAAVILAAEPGVASAHNAKYPPGPVSVGNHGQVNSITMACPNWKDVTTFMDSYSSSMQAKDTVGEAQAIGAALQAGCATFHAGGTGLVISVSGFLERYDEVWMDSDQNAYWMPAGMVSPIPGQPNNP